MKKLKQRLEEKPPKQVIVPVHRQLAARVAQLNQAAVNTKVRIADIAAATANLEVQRARALIELREQQEQLSGFINGELAQQAGVKAGEGWIYDMDRRAFVRQA